MFFKKFPLSLFLGLMTVLSVQGGSVDIQDGEYLLQWSIQEDDIEVEATVRGIGYVGFGIGPNPNMIGADFFLSGVNTANNTEYHWDMHGVANNFPIMDTEDNYELLSAQENETHTTVRFRRALISSDKTEDLDIVDSIQYVQWAVGSTDSLEYHFAHRGYLELNLLADPDRH